MKTKLITKLIIVVLVSLLMGVGADKGGVISQLFGKDKKQEGAKKEEKMQEEAKKPGAGDPFADLDPKDKALFDAIRKKDLTAVQAALDSGANVNAKAKGDMAPIVLAGGSTADIVKLLIEKKADVNVKTAKGLTALTAAKKKNSQEIIDLLTAAGEKE